MKKRGLLYILLLFLGIGALAPAAHAFGGTYDCSGFRTFGTDTQTCDSGTYTWPSAGFNDGIGDIQYPGSDGGVYYLTVTATVNTGSLNIRICDASTPVTLTNSGTQTITLNTATDCESDNELVMVSVDSSFSGTLTNMSISDIPPEPPPSPNDYYNAYINPANFLLEMLLLWITTFGTVLGLSFLL